MSAETWIFYPADWEENGYFPISIIFHELILTLSNISDIWQQLKQILSSQETYLHILESYSGHDGSSGEYDVIAADRNDDQSFKKKRNAVINWNYPSNPFIYPVFHCKKVKC